ncbi:MAG: glycerol-3-phosphate 1-O-acyltransferase PlsY [Holosporaceae bacterium]|jgi:glycerol-3-phosphate acyltransferase PlsY|nr:glycerol-3-phosphate 1-O-acyltransferase PlsY [Holosporaceae bacterium]
MICYFYPLLAYISGSIPFGLILSELFGKGKLREKGSKNIGATNVIRTQGKILGLLTFLLDFLKGLIPCYFLKTDNEILNLLILAAPVIGHIFPIWLKFKGGKGIAAYFGILYALNPFVCLSTAFIWVTMFAVTKISAAAGLLSITAGLAIFCYAGISLCLNFINQLYVLMGLVVLIFLKHTENIKRLIKKELSSGDDEKTIRKTEGPGRAVEGGKTGAFKAGSQRVNRSLQVSRTD